MAFITTALAAALAAPATAQPAAKRPAPAAAAGPVGDVRCLMTMVALARQPQKEAQAMGQAGVYFFSGRISSRGAQPLGGIMKAQAASLGPQELQAELKRCAPMVQNYMKNVEAGLNSLRPPGAPPSSAPPAAATPPAATVPAPPAAATPPPK